MITVTSVLALAPTSVAPASALTLPPIVIGLPTWSVEPITDAGEPIAMSSPTVANLSGGPAVVVGDEAGYVYSYNLATGRPVWRYSAGAPVNSTPSVAVTSGTGGLDSVFVDTGDAAQPTAGGYEAITPTGGIQWLAQETNPSFDATAHNGVQASMAVGNLQGSTDVVAPSLGQNEDALNAATGSLLGGFPWFQADSDFSTPALANLSNNGQTDIVEGGDSSAGVAFGTQYVNGGHLRVLSPTGASQCEYNTNETVQSSPAVGEFFGSSQQVGIVFGTGQTFTSSDTDKLIAVDTQCALKWSATLDGNTKSSPALADVLGNGQLQVVEGTDNGTTGSVWALNGANGSTAWTTRVGRVIGSVVTADLGSGYQDVLAPTVNGVFILDGKTGAVLADLQPETGFQNSPLVTDDPDGTIGITMAGYQAGGSVLYHYEIVGSHGAGADEPGAWPQFHHDPQLTGDAGTAQNIQAPCTAPRSPSGYDLSASDGGIFTFGNLPFCGSTGAIALNKPVVGMATKHDGGGYWEVASDGGIFTFGDAAFFGSTGGLHLNQPIVGMAATPDAKGYWLVASDGGIFTFGDAKFYGSTGATTLQQPIVGMAADPTRGYWLVAADGGVFSFGGAKFFGSTGNVHLDQPIVGLMATADGDGYRFVAADGGVFNFGDAGADGSLGGQHLNKPIAAISGT